MKSAICQDLPYQRDCTALYSALRELPRAVLLDSAAPYSRRGRYDILAADPLAWHPDTSDITQKTDSYSKNINQFDEIRRLLNERLAPLAPVEHLPFSAGAIGYFAYDLGRESLPLPARPDTDLTLAPLGVGIYGWAVITDHHRQRTCLAAHPDTPAAVLRDVLARLRDVPAGEAGRFRLTGPISANLEREQYLARFRTVQDYIQAGDCYQINLARRFTAPCEGDPWQAYRLLRELAAAPYSAYLETEGAALLSFSPERFLQLQGREVRTEPIKGTAARSPDPDEDRRLAQALLHSEKNRAENLMIVDLLRNDLGKCCEPGSIQVDSLFELQSFNTVHHLVSTVRGRLRPDADALTLLAACFPGGSITGAPKRRAMEIIDELESHRRSVYCGSIGYIGADGAMDSNIAIRTMLCEAKRLLCWSGGGIVADSIAEDEFEETWNKVGRLLERLGEM